MAEPVRDHKEAWDIACYKSANSPSARCYIDAVKTLRALVDIYCPTGDGRPMRLWRRARAIAGAADSAERCALGKPHAR